MVLKLSLILFDH